MTLARFTPSILPGETLEQLFVHRHHLLDDVMAAVHEAAEGDGRRHRLFVGPRGAGKTHLISLVNHRIKQARADGLRVGLSWLTEDPWDIETYDDLVGQILTQAVDNPNDVGGERGLAELVKRQGPTVVIVENLDQVLNQIGIVGQRRLRALLENTRSILFVATSTRLSAQLLSQTATFYGFFDATELQPFSVAEASDMLKKIAVHGNDESLLTMLESPTAAARLATVAHLAGGQPRVWALLCTGLVESGADDVIETLLARFDDLTPYYQEQLLRLSASERKAVRRIADADRPLTVREMASLVGVTQRSMSKTVFDLQKRGWLRRYESVLTKSLDARSRYYQLAEPLARIAFQMKEARGEPVRLVVDFLSLWFEQEKLSAIPSVNDQYRVAAQHRAGWTAAVTVALSRRSFIRDPRLKTSSLLSDVGAALHSLQSRNDASAIMNLPAAISGLVSQRLDVMPVEMLRLMVAEFGVLYRIPGDWRATFDEVASVYGGELRARSLAGLAVLAETDGERFELIRQLLSEVSNLHRGQTLVLFGWFAAALPYSRETAEALLNLSTDSSLAPSEFTSTRVMIRMVASRRLAFSGDFIRAEAEARAILADESSQMDEGVRDSLSAVTLATVLVDVGKESEAIALLDAEIESGSFVETEANLIRTRARLKLRGLHADGVPDGLGLGEGLEPGEAGVGGP